MASLQARAALYARDDNVPFGYVEQDGVIIPWWYSTTGIIVKWVLFAVVVTLFFGWVILGTIHAKRRIRKGLPPLRYHRCFVSRRDLASVDPNYAYPQPTYVNYNNHQPNGYPMYNMPPPVYDPSRPPIYEGPPAVGSKVDPSQGRTQTHRPEDGNAAPDYAPPPGPPPATR